jgi:hypothetical protein
VKRKGVVARRGTEEVWNEAVGPDEQELDKRLWWPDEWATTDLHQVHHR